MNRYKVFAKNIVTEDMVYLGEVWATSVSSARVKAAQFEKELEAYDTLVCQKG